MVNLGYLSKHVSFLAADSTKNTVDSNKSWGKHRRIKGKTPICSWIFHRFFLVYGDWEGRSIA